MTISSTLTDIQESTIQTRQRKCYVWLKISGSTFKKERMVQLFTLLPCHKYPVRLATVKAYSQQIEERVL